jgi:hypothetical protein
MTLLTTHLSIDSLTQDAALSFTGRMVFKNPYELGVRDRPERLYRRQCASRLAIRARILFKASR